MKDKNDIECSYAILEKEKKNAIIIFKDLECAIYDYDALLRDDFDFNVKSIKRLNMEITSFGRNSVIQQFI